MTISAAEKSNPPPIKLQHTSPRNEHQIGRYLGRPGDFAVERFVVVISGDVVDWAVQAWNAWPCRSQVVLMQSEIANLNCHVHAGRELRYRPSELVELPMHVANERDHVS